MKKIIIATLGMFIVSVTYAQSIYDATKIADKDLNGTARFVGMGGAMGALGGDISTIGTNPAGIGIYRSNDVMTSFSFSAYGMESKYNDNTFNNDKNRWSYDNIGVVFASKIGNQTPLRYVNFGFNYKRTKSLYKNMAVDGWLGAFDGHNLSQSNYMAQQATDASEHVWRKYDGELLNLEGKGIFTDEAAGWLGILGFQGGMTEMFEHDGSWNSYGSLAPSEAYGRFYSKETGGVNQYDFNVAFNINDRVYFGVTIGAYDVDYSKHVNYDETYDTGEGYLLETRSKIKGSGADFKLGAIIRPFESSPLRIGLAVHSPVFYKLTYSTNAFMQTDYIAGDDMFDMNQVDTYQKLDGDMSQEYRLRTPWKYNFSLGYTVGSSLAIGAEYEYEDYSKMKFSYPDGEEKSWETDEAKLSLQGEHTFRIGAEYKVIPQFAFRLGYNYSSAIFKEDAIKALPANSVMTDTDFANTRSRNNYTLGIGYRGSLFYADLAYQLSTYKEDFYPFYNEFESAPGKWDLVTPQPTKVTNTRSQVLVTLGMRF